MNLVSESGSWSLRQLFLYESEVAAADDIQGPFHPGERLRWITTLEPRVRAWNITSLAPELGEKGSCFLNAYNSELDGADYTEGVTKAIDKNWYHHAYLTAGDLAVETTWRWVGYSYIGVAFTHEEIAQWQGLGPSRSMLWESEALWLCDKE